METISKINPVLRVALRSETVDVTEMSWKDYLRAAGDLSKTLMLVLDPKTGTVNLTPEGITKAILSTEGLTGFVLEKSTGKDKKWVESLPMRDCLLILDAAVTLNVTEENINLGKTLASRLGEVLALKKTSSPQSTTSSALATP